MTWVLLVYSPFSKHAFGIFIFWTLNNFICRSYAGTFESVFIKLLTFLDLRQLQLKAFRSLRLDADLRNRFDLIIRFVLFANLTLIMTNSISWYSLFFWTDFRSGLFLSFSSFLLFIYTRWSTFFSPLLAFRSRASSSKHVGRHGRNDYAWPFPQERAFGIFLDLGRHCLFKQTRFCFLAFTIWTFIFTEVEYFLNLRLNVAKVAQCNLHPATHFRDINLIVSRINLLSKNISLRQFDYHDVCLKRIEFKKSWSW